MAVMCDKRVDKPFHLIGPPFSQDQLTKYQVVRCQERRRSVLCGCQTGPPLWLKMIAIAPTIHIVAPTASLRSGRERWTGLFAVMALPVSVALVCAENIIQGFCIEYPVDPLIQSVDVRSADAVFKVAGKGLKPATKQAEKRIGLALNLALRLALRLALGSALGHPFLRGD